MFALLYLLVVQLLLFVELIPGGKLGIFLKPDGFPFCVVYKLVSYFLLGSCLVSKYHDRDKIANRNAYWRDDKGQDLGINCNHLLL